MKFVSNLLLVLVAAAIGLAVGLAFRGKPTAQSAASLGLASPSPDSPQKGSGVLNRRTRVRFNDDSPLATQLEQDLSMSSGVTRWLYWLEALERAAPADFPRLARLAQANPAALRFVATRWVDLAPRHLFDTLVAATKNGGGGLPVRELAEALFNEWPKREP